MCTTVTEYVENVKYYNHTHMHAHTHTHTHTHTMQGVLYKEYCECRREWEEEREKTRREAEELSALREQDCIKLEELEVGLWVCLVCAYIHDALHHSSCLHSLPIFAALSLLNFFSTL